MSTDDPLRPDPPASASDLSASDAPVSASDAPAPADEPPIPGEPPPETPSFRERSGRFWARHRTLFWMLHSVWALATGVAVVFLARERYAFVPWVVVFLGLTWASTLFFGRSAEHEVQKGEPGPGVAREVTSYVTRSLYQETLFFLLPFYAYSTVVSSINVVFLALLGGLALLSCLDLLFDRWLRTRPVFGMVFFATVAFAAVNLILPMLLGLPPRFATPLAALVAVASAVPLALKAGPTSRAGLVRMGLAAATILVVALGVPSVVPPVPLRMQSATFATGIDRETLALSDTLAGTVAAAAAGDRMVVLVEVFAPASIPTRVQLVWRRNGEVIHHSRAVEIVAHEWRFRVWDAWRPEEGRIPPGDYEITLRTATGRIFGVARLGVT